MYERVIKMRKEYAWNIEKGYRVQIDERKRRRKNKTPYHEIRDRLSLSAGTQEK